MVECVRKRTFTSTQWQGDAMTKYVGMDVHDTSTTIVVLDADGDQIANSVVQTRPQEMIAAVNGYQERTEVVFEEAQWAAWLYEHLKPHVERVVVHAAEDEGDKTDLKDASRLAKWLRLGELNEVYHGPKVDTQLKLLVKAYDRAANAVRNEKNRLKSFFVSQQIECEGTAVYAADQREDWLEKLDGRGAKLGAVQCYEALELRQRHKEETKAEMKRVAKQRDGWGPISSLPGFGPVRTSKVLGLIGTPWRFPAKQKLWSYVGLAVQLDETSQYEPNEHGELELRESQRTRGLQDDYNRRLKDVFIGATETAIQHYEEVREDYRARCRRKPEYKAKLDIARKLVSQCWTIWKRQEEYDEDKACWDEL